MDTLPLEMRVAERIAQVVDASSHLSDPATGIDEEGRVTISIDVAATSFAQAVASGVAQVEQTLKDSGLPFPIDRSTLPDPADEVWR